MLTINQTVLLIVTRGRITDRYRSRVEALSEEGIHIAVPVVRGHQLWIPTTYPVSVQFASQKPGREGRYSFESIVRDHKQEPVPVLLLKHPDQIRRIQDRAFFRLQACLKVRFYLEGGRDAAGDASLDGTVELRNAHTADISGNGMLLCVEEGETIEVGDTLGLIINLQGEDGRGSGIDEAIVTRGRVVRVTVSGDLPGGEGSDDVRGLGIEFLDLDPTDRDRIVGWMFARQSELRRKGLL